MLGYAECVGTLDNGDDCVTGDECVSGFCNGGVCSECESDDDCYGGTCVDDTDGVGYWVCEGGLLGLGEPCTDGAECFSGFCYEAQNMFEETVCSECETNDDCGDLSACVYWFGYAVCMGI